MSGISMIGITLDAIGTILIALMALRVHDRVRKEHRIDADVLQEMRRERALGVGGVVLIILGYVFQLIGQGV